jgi:hypothetical protein
MISKRSDASVSSASIVIVNTTRPIPIDGGSALCSPAAATISGDGVSPAASAAAS